MKAPNYYPYFSTTDPVQEGTVTVPQSPDGQVVTFSASVGDQNLDDTLYIRWISDYPPYAPNVTKVLLDGPDGLGMPLPPPIPPAEIRQNALQGLTYGLRCEYLAPNMQQHRLVLIVSDRPFLKATSGEDSRYSRVATRTDGSNSPVTYPITAGWNIICPP